MKKFLYALLIIVVVIATAILLHLPQPPEPAPKIILNPSPEVVQKADKVYAATTKITLPKELQPNQKEKVTGKVILEDKTTGDMLKAETPAEVSKDDDGNVIVITKTEIAVIKPPESRWKVVVAHEGDIGISYEVGRLRPPFWKALDLGIDGDVFLTQRRLGAGMSKEFKYGYIGIGESFDFREERFEPVVYAGVKVSF